MWKHISEQKSLQILKTLCNMAAAIVPRPPLQPTPVLEASKHQIEATASNIDFDSSNGKWRGGQRWVVKMAFDFGSM
jgi:hypothetical protein